MHPHFISCSPHNTQHTPMASNLRRRFNAMRAQNGIAGLISPHMMAFVEEEIKEVEDLEKTKGLVQSFASGVDVDALTDEIGLLNVNHASRVYDVSSGGTNPNHPSCAGSTARQTACPATDAEPLEKAQEIARRVEAIDKWLLGIEATFQHPALVKVVHAYRQEHLPADSECRLKASWCEGGSKKKAQDFTSLGDNDSQ